MSRVNPQAGPTEVTAASLPNSEALGVEVGAVFHPIVKYPTTK